METVSFALPDDPDQKKVAAASLTAAVALLMAGGDSPGTALEKTQKIHMTVLGAQPLGGVLNTWNKLGG